MGGSPGVVGIPPVGADDPDAPVFPKKFVEPVCPPIPDVVVVFPRLKRPPVVDGAVVVFDELKLNPPAPPVLVCDVLKLKPNEDAPVKELREVMEDLIS